MPSTSEELTSQQAAPKRYEGDIVGLLEAVPGALVGVDRAGVIRYINRRAQSLFGYAHDDLVGRPVETLVPDSIRPGHPAHREVYFAGPGIRRPEPDPDGKGERLPAKTAGCLRGRHRDGTEFPMNLSLSRVDTEDGLLVIAAVRDMTDRENGKDKRDRMSRLASIVEPSTDANISIGPDGLITSWNAAAELLYGRARDEMIGKPASFLLPDLGSQTKKPDADPEA